METVPSADAPLSSATPSSVRSIYLARLRRLLDLRCQYYTDLNRQGVRLLDRSIFAAYCDCREAGAGEEAADVLREAGVPLGPQRSTEDGILGPELGGTEDRPAA